MHFLQISGKESPKIWETAPFKKYYNIWSHQEGLQESCFKMSVSSLCSVLSFQLKSLKHPVSAAGVLVKSLFALLCKWGSLGQISNDIMSFPNT